MPESTANGVHYPGTYVAGTYNRLADVVDGHRIVNESVVNLPNWLVTALRIDGGAWLDLARDEVVQHWQQLDLRKGILLRHTRLRDPAGRTTRIVQRRLVSMDRPHVAALETTVTAEDWSGRLTVRSGLAALAGAGGADPVWQPVHRGDAQPRRDHAARTARGAASRRDPMRVDAAK
jgi:trehalose 6-phosphate phosphatase